MKIITTITALLIALLSNNICCKADNTATETAAAKAATSTSGIDDPSAAAKPDTTVLYNGRVINISGSDNRVAVDITDSNGSSSKTVYKFEKDSVQSRETFEVDDQFNFPFSRLIMGRKGSRDDSDSGEYKYGRGGQDSSAGSSASSSSSNGDSKKKKNKRFDSADLIFYLGFNTLTNSGFNVDMGRSREIGFDIMAEEHAFSRHFGLSYGLGFNWRNWRVDDRLFNYERKKLSLSDVADNVEVDYSRLRTFRFTLPVLFELQTDGEDGFSFRFGAVGEVVPTARLRSVYSVNGEEFKVNNRNLRHNVLGASFIASVGFNGLSVYCRYTPTPLFQEKVGAKFQTLTVGLSFGF